jgi:hypothetical protein
VRGRSRSKGPNPLTRSYESNGPDVKVRGTAQHVADKYAQLARDAQSSGDPVAAENYYQHAEHYYRIIAGAQEQFRQQLGGYGQRPFDEDGEDGDEEAGPNGFPYPGERAAGAANGETPDFGNQPQPYDGRRDDRSQPFDGRRDDRSQVPDNRRNDRSQPFDGRRDDRSQRFDRNERFGADRGGDRYGRDRNDRPPANRPPERGERYDRGERSDNGADRRDRDDRSDRGPRPETGPERFGRSEQGAQRPPEPPRENRAETRGDGQRFEGRPPERRREETEEPAGLPAFLTNPVRAPIAVEEAAVEASPAPADAGGSEAAEGEGNGRPRARRRRTRYKGPEENGGEAPETAAPAEDPTPAE